MCPLKVWNIRDKHYCLWIYYILWLVLQQWVLLLLLSQLQWMALVLSEECMLFFTSVTIISYTVYIFIQYMPIGEVTLVQSSLIHFKSSAQQIDSVWDYMVFQQMFFFSFLLLSTINKSKGVEARKPVKFAALSSSLFLSMLYPKKIISCLPVHTLPDWQRSL